MGRTMSEGLQLNPDGATKFKVPLLFISYQNLAWLSQQGFGNKSSLNSDHESDKENSKTSSSIGIGASPLANGLPPVNVDIASRIQSALWAANFNKDQPFPGPYGSWMNPAVNPGFAAVAAAAAAAMKTSAAAFPTTTSSR